jgi:monoamine oxidase
MSCKKQGYEVTLLEGRERVGGRVWTVREGFADGHVAEIGAVRIPDVHEHTLGYVEELGLELDPLPRRRALYYIGGMRFMHTEGEPWPLPGLNATRRAPGSAICGASTSPAPSMNSVTRATGTFPKAGIVEKYDGQVYIDFLRERGASEAFLPLYTADNGAEVYTIGTLAWMVAEVADKDWERPTTSAAATTSCRSGSPRRSGPTTSCSRTRSCASSTPTGRHRHRGARRRGARFTADHLVCTLPFTTLRDVAISPEFPADKMDTIRGLYLMNAGARVHPDQAPASGRPRASAASRSPRPTPAGRAPVGPQRRPGGELREGHDRLLHAGQERRRLLRQVDGRARGLHPRHIEAFFPEIKAETLAFFHYCWKDDPWVKGAWTDTLPGSGG